MKYIYNTLGLSLICLYLFTSCFKDEGNYAYTTPQTLEINGIDSTYTRLLSDTISIYPTIISNEGSFDTAQYTYEWIKSDYLTNEIISTEWELDQFTLSLPQGNYNMVYRITSRETGLQYSKKFTLDIQNDMTRGFLLMAEVEGKARLDMISFFGTDFYYKKDVLKITGSTVPLNGKPLQVVTYADPTSPPYNNAGYAIYLLTSEESNRVLHKDFSFKPEYALKYQISISPPGFVADNIVQNQGVFYLYANQNIYSSNRVFSIAWNYGYPTNIINGEIKPFNASPHIVMTTMQSVAYDTDSKSFVSHSVMSRNMERFESKHNTLFSFQNTGKELIKIQTVESAYFYAILDSVASHQRYLAVAYFGGEQLVYQKIIAPDFASANLFAIPNEGKYIYYVSKDASNIYRYAIAEGQTTIVHTAKAGYKINLMKFLDKGTPKPFPVQLYEHLFVSSYDPSAVTGEDGRLEILKIEGAGKLVPVQYNNKDLTWDKIAKVVSLDYKSK